MGNPIVHVEFSSRNPAKAKVFYESLFDWKFQFDPKMNYYMFEPGQGPGGGLFQNDQMPPGVQVYVGVPDVDASLKKAEALGAQVLRWKDEIPGFGWFGMFRDPEGITMAVYQALMAAPPAKPAVKKATAKAKAGAKKAKAGAKKAGRRRR